MIERVPWPEFVEHRLDWRQGEHVTLIGPTGAGKTTAALALLPLRSYVLALATKPRDATMTKLTRSGWRLARSWDYVPSPAGRRELRVVVWPKFRSDLDAPAQSWEISRAVRGAFVAGGWAIFADELWYLVNMLGMRRLLETVWTQGRSNGVSLIGATQRPAHVPLLAYDQATHLFFWRDNDPANLKRIAGLGGLNASAIRGTVGSLARHDVLYVNTRTGDKLITRAPHK